METFGLSGKDNDLGAEASHSEVTPAFQSPSTPGIRFLSKHQVFQVVGVGVQDKAGRDRAPHCAWSVCLGRVQSASVTAVL